MHGEIWVESQLGEGSTFHLRIPFGTVSPAEIPKSRQDLSVYSGLKILIVDDNATNRRILIEMCANWGMSPEAVDGAVAAIQAILQAEEQGAPYSLVITDCSMPEVDGFELAQRLRTLCESTEPVLMMLSSLDRKKDLAECERLGIRAYLTKPVKQSDLLDAVASVLDLSVRPVESSTGATQNLPRIKPLHILLAEDSLANRTLAIGVMSRWGHQISVATNGREAVEAMQRGRFDLVLMDVQMPEMDGLTATRKIRELQDANVVPACPIIALTAHAMKGDRERCLEAGMDNYITKPVRPFDLASLLAHYGQPVEEPLLEISPQSIASSDGRNSAMPDSLQHAGQSTGTPERPAGNRAAASALDWGVLMATVQQDEQLANVVADAFLAETPRLMEQLKTALAASDGPAARIAAHTMKGSLRAIGAPSQQLAAELETHSTQQNWEPCPELLTQLDAAVRTIEVELQKHLDAINPTAM
jgi:CheY-like chemotaxis protein